MTFPNFQFTPRQTVRPEIGQISLAHEPAFRLGALEVEPAARRLAHDDGREAFLEPRVMQVLVALARAGGQIVSRDELLEACWRGVVVGEDALNRVIGRLRRLAEGLGDGTFSVETITKVGYRLTAASATTETAQPVAAVAPAEAEARGPSVCVLPFTNMSDDPQQEYFSDGISEDIITDLSKVSSLFVTARTTAFTFRNRDLDVPRLAQELGVSHVLEGSVRKAGGRVRVTAQLIDGASGGHVWAERYDRDLADIFAIQDEISEAIVAALKLKLLPEEKQAMEQRGARRAEAYDLYLMARRYYSRSREGDPRSLQAITRLCRRAVELDPDYALAWSLLAVAQTALISCHIQIADDGDEAVERALALDPSLAEARAVKARRLLLAGHAVQALEQIELALSLDPQSWLVNAEAGRLYYRLGRFSDAVPYLEDATRLGFAVGDPDMLLSALHALGDEVGARRAAKLLLARAEAALARDSLAGEVMGCAVSALAALGEMARARETVEQALLVDPANTKMLYNLACGISGFMGDQEWALEVMTPVFDSITPGLLEHAQMDPDLVGLHANPRFRALVAAARQRLAATAV